MDKVHVRAVGGADHHTFQTEGTFSFLELIHKTNQKLHVKKGKLDVNLASLRSVFPVSGL